MSRLTGKESFGLMEAYQAVYAPQELTEEQVWEGVENWVHSLLEEGYDLSDYTWEEMYEGYITEVNLAGQKGLDKVRSDMDAERQSATKLDDARAKRFGPGVYRTVSPAQTAAKIEPYKSKFAGARDAAFEKAKQIKGSPVLGPKIVGSGTSPTPARPAAPATSSSPAATAPSSSPAAAKTTTPEKKMGGDPMDQWARANPTLAAKVKPGQSGYDTIKARLSADNDRQENYDAYDLVLSHLINEGYADTQEAALAIMGNMSEEWSQSIISEGPNYDKNRQRAAKRAAERNEARKRGQTGNVPGIGYVSPRPERETYRDAAGVERHTSGARMPKKD